MSGALTGKTGMAAEKIPDWKRGVSPIGFRLEKIRMLIKAAETCVKGKIRPEMKPVRPAAVCQK